MMTSGVRYDLNCATISAALLRSTRSTTFGASTSTLSSISTMSGVAPNTSRMRCATAIWPA
jgi:hypothetical protein